MRAPGSRQPLRAPIDETGTAGHSWVQVASLQRERDQLAEQQRAILDAIPAMIALLDADGTILAVNTTWRRVAGANGFDDAMAGIGGLYLDVCQRATGMPDSALAQAREHIRAVLNGSDDPGPVTYLLGPAGRQSWFDLMVTPVSSGPGSGAVVMHLDVTHAKRAEQQLVLAKADAEAANQTKSEFLANISHELRTPLNAIMGFSDMMRERTFGPLGAPKYNEYAHDIHDSARHLLSLIDDILDLSKIDAGKFELFEESISIEECLSQVLRIINPRALAARITIVVENGCGCRLTADERSVKQVLINLLSNAVKFSPAGSVITIRLAQDEAGCHLAVADQGIGMSPDEIPRALEPFRQVSMTRNGLEGTGLGLPLAQRLMELHGGKLRIVSSKGQGTTVTISFPPERVRSAAGKDQATV